MGIDNVPKDEKVIENLRNLCFEVLQPLRDYVGAPVVINSGHLSNEAAAECLVRILARLGGKKVPRVLLAHLSKENNTPEQAYITVKNILEEEGFYVGKDLELEVVDREETGRFLAV